MLSELLFTAGHGAINGDRHMYDDHRTTLANLEKVDLIAAVPGSKGDEMLIKLTQLGYRVGGKLCERRQQTQGLARKENGNQAH